MATSNFHKLSLICLISATVPSSSALTTAVSAAQAVGLLSRDSSTCGGNSGLQTCGSDFPSSFCCPTSSTCVPLNNTLSVSSVICCPKGANCNFIQPITCDVSQLNATLHPENQIHISNTTDVQLPKCGGSGNCCPLGYTCSNGMCSAQTSNSPTSTSPSSNPSSSATGSSVPAASQTSGSTPPIPTSSPSPSSFSGKSFAAGFLPGLILGALLTLLVLFLLKKRRERKRYSGDFGHVARTVSDPIYDPVYAARTDFLRRGSNSAQPSPSSATNMVQNGQQGTRSAGGSTFLGTPRVKSLFSRSPKLGVGTGAPAKAPRDPYTTPTRTPQTYLTRSNSNYSSPNAYNGNGNGKRMTAKRSESTETIDVLMPAPTFLQPPQAPAMKGDRPLTQGTTFTSLMEGAGFGRDSRDGVRGWHGSPMRKL